MAPVELDMSERNGGSGIDKDALMKLIAQEMVTSLLSAGNDDDDDDDAILKQLQAKLVEREKARKLKKKSRRKSKTIRRPSDTELLASPTPTAKSSLEDVFYSQMSGMDVPVSPARPPMMPPTPTEVLKPGDDIEVNIKDHDDDSFAGGCLDGLVDDKHRRASMGSSGRSSGGGSIEEGGTARSTKSGSSRDTTIRSAELGMEEIRKYVLENIPQAVRDQIPPEAWAQIFNVDGASTPNTASLASKMSSEKKKQEPAAPFDQIVINGHDSDLDDDNITVFSDVSGLTGAFPDGKHVERNREILNNLSRVEEGSQDGLPEAFRSNSHAPEAPGEYSAYEGSHSREQGPKGMPVLHDAPLGRKKVTWSQVEVRYYERIVSDNPSVQSGPAIGIGWRYKRGGRVDVDYWEQSRGTPRESAELVLPRHIRERLLREAGVSQKEMAEMVRLTLKIKNQRKQTVNNLPTSGMEEVVEKARRRFTRILTLGRSKDNL